MSTSDFSSNVAAIIPTKIPQNHVEYKGVCNLSLTIAIHLKFGEVFPIIYLFNTVRKYNGPTIYANSAFVNLN